MKKLYEKNELTFALLWIVVYCVLQSLANPLNKAIGVAYSASAVFCILQAVILLAFIRKNHLQIRYGLCKSPVPACQRADDGRRIRGCAEAHSEWCPFF